MVYGARVLGGRRLRGGHNCKKTPKLLEIKLYRPIRLQGPSNIRL